MWGSGLQPYLSVRHVGMTTPLGKKYYHHSPIGVLGGIAIPPQNMTKKFHNPNFVNCQNPHVHSKPASVRTTAALSDCEIPVAETTEAMGKNAKRSRKNRRKGGRKNAADDEERPALREEPVTKPLSVGEVASVCLNMSSSPIDIIRTYHRSAVAFTISPPKRSWLSSRSPSICESEDSLCIVFEEDEEEEAEEAVTCRISYRDESDEGEGFDSYDDGEDGGEKESNRSYRRRNCDRANIKKVRFADDSGLCEVHPMVQWSFAYQAARKGPWEEFARDRERFKLRVSNAESVLSPVLRRQHRDEVYEKRFKNIEANCGGSCDPPVCRPIASGLP